MKEMTTDDKARILKDILHDEGVDIILQISGVWELLSEEYNNSILSRWEEEQEEGEQERQYSESKRLLNHFDLHRGAVLNAAKRGDIEKVRCGLMKMDDIKRQLIGLWREWNDNP